MGRKMFTFIYKRVINVAMQHSLIRKKQAVRLLNILKYGKPTCEICKYPINKRNKKLKESIDHKIPISKGGTEEFKNLRIAHRICNNRKGAKIGKDKR